MPLNIDWQQILLHLLNFVILFAGLWLLLYKPVRKFMNARRETYEKADADAEQKRAEAERLRAEYEKKLADADVQIAERRERARKEAEAYEEERCRAAQQQAEAILSEAQASAERERQRAVKEARGEIADLVASATEKLVLHESASEAYDQFLDAVEHADNNGGKA